MAAFVQYGDVLITLVREEHNGRTKETFTIRPSCHQFVENADDCMSQCDPAEAGAETSFR